MNEFITNGRNNNNNEMSLNERIFRYIYVEISSIAGEVFQPWGNKLLES